jgi:hypothetical protein
MNSQVNRLYTMTLHVAERIDNTQVDELLELVQCRDEVLESLSNSGAVSEEERTLLIGIKEYDHIISSRMNLLMEEAKQGLSNIAKTRTQKRTYEKLYAGESYFIDIKE